MGMDSELEPADQYRRLSPLAVVAFLGGLLSSLALVSSGYWVVAFLAAAFALFAIWQIEQKTEQLAGAHLARWGLVLAILFGVAAVARTKITTRLFHEQAQQTVTVWVETLAEGRLEEAMELLTRKAATGLMTAPASPDEPPPTAQQARNLMLRSLSENPLVKQTQRLGKALQIEPVGQPLPPTVSGSSRNLFAVYRLSGKQPDDEDQGVTFTVVVAWPSQQTQTGSLTLIDQWNVIPW